MSPSKPLSEITLRTRRAAHEWRYQFAKTQTSFPTLMIRGEVSEIFGRRAKVWVIEIPAELQTAAGEFFPQPVICQ